MEITCHCKNITLQADLPSQVTVCNCSICSRYNTLWGYYSPEHVTISVGEGGEQYYIWGDKMLEFVRCAVCGCVTHYRTVNGDPNPKIAINFRMVSESITSNIPVRHFNGRELL